MSAVLWVLIAAVVGIVTVMFVELGGTAADPFDDGYCP